jgi:predicted nucleic acid-binding protein
VAPTHLLDTSVFCQPIKDRPLVQVLERWDQLGDEATCTSAVCLGELLQGLEYRRSEKYWRRYRQLIEHRYAVLALDEAVAVDFGKLSAELRRLRSPRPVVDLWIAATARRHGLIVATLNVRDFRDVPGVGVEDWSVP